MIVADSDVLIDFLRGRGEGARRVAIELETRSFATTAITSFEIRSGARTARQKRAVEILLEAMTVLPFGPEEARIAVDGILLTRNRKHFERIKGLRLSGRTVGEP